MTYKLVTFLCRLLKLDTVEVFDDRERIFALLIFAMVFNNHKFDYATYCTQYFRNIVVIRKLFDYHFMFNWTLDRLGQAANHDEIRNVKQLRNFLCRTQCMYSECRVEPLYDDLIVLDLRYILDVSVKDSLATVFYPAMPHIDYVVYSNDGVANQFVFNGSIAENLRQNMPDGWPYVLELTDPPDEISLSEESVDFEHGNYHVPNLPSLPKSVLAKSPTPSVEEEYESQSGYDCGIDAILIVLDSPRCFCDVNYRFSTRSFIYQSQSGVEPSADVPDPSSLVEQSFKEEVPDTLASSEKDSIQLSNAVNIAGLNEQFSTGNGCNTFMKFNNNSIKSKALESSGSRAGSSNSSEFRGNLKEARHFFK